MSNFADTEQTDYFMKRLFVIAVAFIFVVSANSQTDSEKASLRSEIEKDLTEDILPFWVKYAPDIKHGGFYGTILGDGRGKDTPKSAILGARILWTFSTAYRVYANAEYKRLADIVQQYYIRNFVDSKYGGVYYLLKPKGKPADDSKQTYACAFAIYGLSEHFRATGDTMSLNTAKTLFRTLEDKVHDKVNGGYREAYTRNYKNIVAEGVDAKSGPTKTMNTHIHILEAYTNLYKVWPDEELKTCLKELINILETKLYSQQTAHLILFCDDNWTSLYPTDSYGHDIETSWLLTEAAEALGDSEVLMRIRKQAVRMTDVALAEGLTNDGDAMIYEKNMKGYERKLSWWVQCEAVTGCLNAWQITGEKKYFDQAVKFWNFIKSHYVDAVNGGWWKNLDANGNHIDREPKGSMWNCPYHNSRLGFETMRRLAE